MPGCVVSVQWASADIEHRDDRYVPGVGPRDALEMLTGERAGAALAPGVLVAPWQASRLLDLDQSQLEPQPGGRSRIEPRTGQHYPVQLLQGVEPELIGGARVFRCLSASDGGLRRADLNHPLARAPLRLDARADPERASRGSAPNERQLRAWVLDTGIGLQGRREDAISDWPTPADLRRADESDDTLFYEQPRLVTHIDDEVIAQIGTLYGRLLPPGARVLDLMSSWISHLPEDLGLESVSGLGMNEPELSANPRLNHHRVHDLNREPRLPYPDRAFDAVICTVSVEYLNQPRAIFAEVARILNDGGLFVNTFSNRCFPTKAIALWGRLHEFERMGFVAHLLLDTGYRDVQTWSVCGRPASTPDPLGQATKDPVYAVWGRTA